MEPTPSSLRWASTDKDKDVTTLKVGSKEKNIGLALRGTMRSLGLSFSSGLKRSQGMNAQERTGQLVARWVHLSSEKVVKKLGTQVIQGGENTSCVLLGFVLFAIHARGRVGDLTGLQKMLVIDASGALGWRWRLRRGRQ